MIYSNEPQGFYTFVRANYYELIDTFIKHIKENLPAKYTLSHTKYKSIIKKRIEYEKYEHSANSCV